jgi:hypothetical protein
MISSSKATFWARSFSTRSVVCWNGTLRSSSPLMNSTGERQFAMLATVDDLQEYALCWILEKEVHKICIASNSSNEQKQSNY